MGRTIMSGMRRWDASTGQELPSLEGSTPGANTFAVSPDGKLIAIGTRNDPNSLDFNQTIKLWDVASSKQSRSLEGQVGEINSIAFSRDGKLIACGSRDHSVRLWDVVSGTQLPPLTGHADVVNSVAFSPDAKLIVSGSRDKTVKLWDTATGKEHNSISRNANDISSISVSPDGNVLALSTGHQIKLWEVTTDQPLRFLEGLTNNSGTSDEEPSQDVSFTFSPDGRTISATDNHSVKLLDTNTGKLLRSFIDEASVVSVAFSHDGKVIASGWNDATIRLWNVGTGQKLHSLSAGCRGGHDRTYVAPVISVNYSPDGKLIASACGGDGAIKFWNAATGIQLHSPEGYYHGIYVAFSPNGRVVASCCSGDETTEDSTISLWNSVNGKPERTLEGVASEVSSVSFSPDGKLISGSLDKSIKLWDALTGRYLRSFEAVNSPVEYVAFTPDGKLILSLGQDNLVRLWQLDGKLLATLASLDQKGWVVFTPDGLFDASPGTEESLHFVVNIDGVYKTHPQSQFKERYYRRGLLQKILRGESVS
jgi:WD40 repeat protein